MFKIENYWERIAQREEELLTQFIKDRMKANTEANKHPTAGDADIVCWQKQIDVVKENAGFKTNDE